MKKQMNRTVLVIMVLTASFALSSCKPMRNDDLAKRVYEMEQTGSAEEPEKIKEIRKDINRWEDELNDAITAGKNTARYYRTLGLKFMDYDMFGPARDSFSRGLEITSSDARMYYYRAVAVSKLAVSRDSAEQTLEEIIQAEEDYKRAISLEPRYMPPYYSIAILYIYELESPFEAESYLQQYLKIERSDGRALLLYGQLLEQMGMSEKAMDQYNTLLSISGFNAEKEQARLYLERVREDAF
jgi:tetratricopeptide (TPR) repeat protein